MSATGARAEMRVEALEERALLSAFEAKVDFRPGKAAGPSEYVVDNGSAFKARKNFAYGWNVDHRAGVYDHNNPRSPDDRYDTIADLQVGKKAYRWEMAVPDGKYLVRVVAGDPNSFKNVLKVKVENTTVVSGTTTKKARWIDKAALVEVKDGRLTVSSAKGAKNNRIAFIEISEARDSTKTLEAESADRKQGTFADAPVLGDVDAGEYLVFENLWLDGSMKSIQARLGVSTEQAGQFIEFRLDSPTGALIGTMETEGEGDGTGMRSQSAAITSATGLHDLYVVFKGDGKIGGVDGFQFSTRPLVRIMPLGDSITEGKDGHDTYRWRLWKLMEAAGYSVDFVGPNHGIFHEDGDPEHMDFDQDHAGYSAYRADQILHGSERNPGGIDALAVAYPADVVLLHLGTNDLFAHQWNKDIAAEVKLIIERLREANPDVIVLLAKILPTDLYGVTLEDVEDLNEHYAALALELSTQQSPVVIVDQYSGFDVDTDLYDRAHPTAAAEAEMATRWFEVLKTVV